jgi:transposase
MARPYSLDLRERLVAAVDRGMSRRRAAVRFGIGISTAIRWTRRFQETGSVRPDKMGGNRPKLIVGEHRAWLLRRIEQGDFTLRGLVAELAARGLKVDYRTMWNFLHGEGLSFKKNRGRIRTRPPRRRAPAEAVDAVSRPGRA